VKIHPFNKFGRLENLSRKLELVARDRWGVTDLQAPFIPLLDLNLGDLGTDYPIRVAAALRRPAIEIGAELAEALKEEGIEFLVYEGFLNVRLGRTEGATKGRINPNSLTPFAGYPPNSIRLILQNRSSRESRWGMFRRAAMLGLQAVLIKVSSKDSSLLVLDGSGKPLPDPTKNSADFWFAVTKLTEQGVVAKKIAAKELALIVSAQRTDLTFLWAAEEVWSQTEYKSLQSGTELITQFGSAAWLEDWGDERECKSTTARIQTYPLDAFFLLSEPMRGSDIDGNILGTNQRANIRWYCGATLERINNLIPKGACPLAAELFEDEHYRRLVLRATFMLDFLSYGAQRGQLWGFLQVLREILDGVNRVVNDPKFRQDLTKGQADPKAISVIQLVRQALEQLNTGA
jgi:hypothetical protein